MVNTEKLDKNSEDKRPKIYKLYEQIMAQNNGTSDILLLVLNVRVIHPRQIIDKW
jgi:hypothetical protein